MDEIGRGTSTYDGLALAWAIARHLVEKSHCHTLFATHYFELTALAAEFKHVANVHLDAVEHKDRIVFLHAVEEGPANRSFGLQVAQLAGVPGTVIRAARRRLAELEEQGYTAAAQRDLFAPDAPVPAEPAPHPALEMLRSADPDTMTPREALDLLYRLRQKLDE
jgi:DNA mismatch repair protein MutS